MNWSSLRAVPWIDTRSAFVAKTPRGGSLLDMGSSNGETLRHIAELRSDLQLFSTDIEGAPETYPKGCQFFRGDIQRDRLPWPDGSIDAITCMHLVEHLQDLEGLFREAARLLKPGGSIYVETPDPKTVVYPSPKGAMLGKFTLNFYDDATHVRPVPRSTIARAAEAAGLQVSGSGTSRNLLFAASWPLFAFLPSTRKKYTARIHWLGWSAFVAAQRPS